MRHFFFLFFFFSFSYLFPLKMFSVLLLHSFGVPLLCDDDDDDVTERSDNGEISMDSIPPFFIAFCLINPSVRV